MKEIKIPNIGDISFFMRSEAMFIDIDPLPEKRFYIEICTYDKIFVAETSDFIDYEIKSVDTIRPHKNGVLFDITKNIELAKKEPCNIPEERMVIYLGYASAKMFLDSYNRERGYSNIKFSSLANARIGKAIIHISHKFDYGIVIKDRKYIRGAK